MMKRLLPYILFVIGIFLLGAVVLYYWHTNLRLPVGSASVPQSIAGVELTDLVTGSAAMDSINNLHGKEIQLVDGAVAVYGQGSVVLWVSISQDAASAHELTQRMVQRIAEGRSPFIENGTFQLGGFKIFDLTGLGQRHYYWQSGKRILWIAVNEELAGEVLPTVVNFYK